MKNDGLSQHLRLGLLGIFVLIVAIALFAYSSLANNISHLETNRNLPDLSGLAWIKEDSFLAVHDSKSLDPNQPRISLINLPQSSKGIEWQTLKIDWETVGGISMDLESITNIPETNLFILAESSHYKKHRGRLFLMKFENSTLKPIAVTNWPQNIINIEAIATTKINNQTYFFYAERGADQPSTNICWTTLSLEPFTIGKCHPTQFSTADPTPHIRQISDIEIDASGNIYIASALDPNQDNGPFKSSVWKIGQVELDQTNLPQITLAQNNNAIAEIDGFKVESLALRPSQNQEPEIFIGTDDENYGGVIRLLPSVDIRQKGKTEN
jgi:hypothetical protein